MSSSNATAGTGTPKAVEHRRGDLPDVPDRRAVDHDRGAPRRVEARRPGPATSRTSASSSASTERVERVDRVVDVDRTVRLDRRRVARAGEHDREVVALVGQELPTGGAAKT